MCDCRSFMTVAMAKKTAKIVKTMCASVHASDRDVVDSIESRGESETSKNNIEVTGITLEIDSSPCALQGWSYDQLNLLWPCFFLNVHTSVSFESSWWKCGVFSQNCECVSVYVTIALLSTCDTSTISLSSHPLAFT